MNIIEYMKLAIQALRTNKTRAILTMLGIIIGVASVILLVSIGSGLQAFVTKQFNSLGANTLFIIPGKVNLRSNGPASPVSQFELSDVAAIERGSQHITVVSPIVTQQTTVTAKGNSASEQVVGVWENYFEVSKYEPASGDIIRQTDVERTRKVIVLGATAATDLFGDTDAVGKTVTLGGVRYDVKGVLLPKGGGGGLGVDIDQRVFIPFTTALRQYNLSKPYALLIQTKDESSVSQAAEDVRRILLKRLKKDDFTVLKQTELLNTISQFLSVITAALGGIAGISLLVGGIGIMNIMLVSVTERTREIGLRKAVGATPRDILIQFLIESVILSLLGGAIGIGLGMLGSRAINQFITTTVTPWSIVLSFGFSAAIGIIFGVAPAIRAARLDPIEALRYE